MFNEEQQKAIETIKGQLILVACPGSGKTTTLLGRIHEMIQQGVPAENILMVTFTTAAAGEMKQRFWKKYAEDGMVTFCTIHSFCLATLKKFAHFDAECVLATGDIYEFFFQQLVRHKEIVDKVEYIKALLLDIAVCKNSMCPLAQFEPNCGEKELFDELFKAYENWKDALGNVSTSYTKGVSIAATVSKKAKDIRETHVLAVKERAGKVTNTILLPMAIFQLMPMIVFLIIPILSELTGTLF